MRYDDFRDRWQAALCEARLLAHVDRPVETMDLTTTERRWRATGGHGLPERAEPFHVSARLGFRWDPFEAARSYTCEEDLLTELFGRRVPRAATQPRLLRLDITLHATLALGSTTPLPAADVWGPWAAAAEEKLEDLLPVGARRRRAPVSWRGDLVVGARSAPAGTLWLEGISVSAFDWVQVPRIWDDPKRREKEKGLDEQLDRLARRFRSAFDAWTASVGELGTWIRYAPARPSRRRRPEPFPEDEDDGGETTH